MLHLTDAVHRQLVALALDEAPLEACGLLAGPPGTGRVERFYPCANVAASARVYTLDPRDHLRADRDAEDRGLEVVGVMHSHTHTDPYPSPTDVEAAVDPGWHYLIVSLRHPEPSVRSYRIEGGEITEEPVVVVAE